MVCSEQVALTLGLKNIKIAIINTETVTEGQGLPLRNGKPQLVTFHNLKDGNRILCEPGR